MGVITVRLNPARPRDGDNLASKTFAEHTVLQKSFSFWATPPFEYRGTIYVPWG